MPFHRFFRSFRPPWRTRQHCLWGFVCRLRNRDRSGQSARYSPRSIQNYPAATSGNSRAHPRRCQSRGAAKKIAVDEVDARRVMHLAIQMDAVGAGNAVLGNIDRQTVPLPDKACPPLHRLRGDGPADGCARMSCGPGQNSGLPFAPARTMTEL